MLRLVMLMLTLLWLCVVVKIKKTDKVVKFKLRLSKYLYTLKVPFSLIAARCLDACVACA